MKKALCVLLSLGLAFLLCACKGETMYLAPAQLSSEEENVVRLLGLDTDHLIYDFTLKDGVQTMEVNTYVLQEGKWNRISGGAQEFVDTKGRLALGFDKIAEGVRIAVQSDHDNGSTSYRQESEEDISQLAVGTVKLDSPTKIVFDEEIPLVLQTMTSQNQIRAFATNQFFDPAALEEQDPEYVYAITVRFSQKTVAQLDAQGSGSGK